MQIEFDDLKEEMKGNPDIFFHFNYDESLSRLLYAAADFMIVPSLFEPCGLTQLISLRYGTVPIVRRTGGLANTVFDNPPEKKNGYTFDTFDFIGINEAIDRALKCWKNNPSEHQKIITRGIHMDFGWEKSAVEYLKVYEKLLS